MDSQCLCQVEQKCNFVIFYCWQEVILKQRE